LGGNLQAAPATALLIVNPRRRALLGGVLLGLGVQMAILDALLLHAVLGWHHALEPGNPTGVWTNPVWVADLALLRRPGAPSDALANGALVGVGLGFAVLDVLVQHWLLGVHQAHPDEPAFTDVALLAIGALLVLAGAWREWRAQKAYSKAPAPSV